MLWTLTLVFSLQIHNRRCNQGESTWWLPPRRGCFCRLVTFCQQFDAVTLNFFLLSFKIVCTSKSNVPNSETWTWSTDFKSLHSFSYLVLFIRSVKFIFMCVLLSNALLFVTVFHGFAKVCNDIVPPAIDFPTGKDPASAFALQKRYNSPGMSPPLST